MVLLSGETDRDILVLLAHQKVADAALHGIEVAVEEELSDIDVALKLRIYAAKNVHLELSGHPLRIVVGHFDHLVVLSQVESYQ